MAGSAAGWQPRKSMATSRSSSAVTTTSASGALGVGWPKLGCHRRHRLAGQQGLGPLGGGEELEGHQLAQDRRRGQVRPHLLEHHGGFHPAQAHPALVLGHGQRRPALFDHGLPQIGVGGAAALGGGPHHRDGRTPVEQVGGRLAQGLLVVGELEVHDRRAYLTLVSTLTPVIYAAPDGPDPHRRAGAAPGRMPPVAPGQPALGVRQRAPAPVRLARRRGGLRCASGSTAWPRGDGWG